MTRDAIDLSKLPVAIGEQNKLPEAKTIRAQRTDEAMRLAQEGMTYRQIGAAIGVSYVTARNYVLEACAALPAVNAAAYREVQNQRCELLWERLEKKLRNGQRTLYDSDGNEVIVDSEQLERTASTAIRLMERVAKLNGLDSPTQVQVQSVNWAIEGVDLGAL